jgi:hypothetical protein
MKFAYKIMYIIAGIIILSSIALVGTLIFWKIYPYEPLKINTQPLRVLTKEVRGGDILIYEIDYCKLSDRTVRISRSFIDGITFSTPDFRTKNLLGCRTSFVSIEVPPTLPAGKYYLKIDYTYQVNPIREVVVNALTERFTVIDN